jgi:hypothetical protein
MHEMAKSSADSRILFPDSSRASMRTQIGGRCRQQRAANDHFVSAPQHGTGRQGEVIGGEGIV